MPLPGRRARSIRNRYRSSVAVAAFLACGVLMSGPAFAQENPPPTPAEQQQQPQTPSTTAPEVPATTPQESAQPGAPAGSLATDQQGTAPEGASPATTTSATTSSAGEETIVVTGSRIARPANATAPTAVTTVGQEAIKLSGATNLSNLLQTVPSFGVPGLSSTNSNFLTSGSGINTLNLRNLGEDRTLVLVNGRRQVAGVPGSAAVDFNTIPVQMIDRVEVITGGASAIYGSDALAGVINVILRNNFNGLEAGYQYGESQQGDYIRESPYVMGGLNFAGGKGNIIGLVSWDRQDGVYARNRSETAIDNIATCALTGVTADCKTPTAPFFSSFPEYGRFGIISTGDQFTVSSGAGPSGTVAPFDSDLFGYNRQSRRIISVPTERTMFALNGHYDFTPNVTGYFESTIAITDTQSDIEPLPLQASDLNITGVSVNNPFVPSAIRDAAIAAGDTEIDFARRLTEVGDRAVTGNREMKRIIAGLKGDIGGGWNYDAYAGYGETRQRENVFGDVNIANFANALNAVDLDGNPATTDDIVCADVAARALGCAPINIFGRGAISDAAAGYVRASLQRNSKVTQTIAGATLGGPIVQLPAGPLDAVFGVEYRKEKADDVPDPLVQAGLTAGNQENAIHGSYDVKEAFFELEAPLIKDQPWIKDLSVGAAYRYSDYDTVGTTDAYTARASYAPVDHLRFRAQYARAVRAPNIGELFAPAGENFAPVADPCNGVTAVDDPTTVVDDNCRAIPAVAARIAATGSFTLTQPEIQGTGGFTGAGNPNLSPETADSWNAGVVYENDFHERGRVLLSVDYYNIKIDDLIGTIDRQQSVDFCFNSTSFPNAFCNALVRDTSGPAFQQGELIEVNSGFINEGQLETSGIDVAASYAFSFQDLFGRPWGDLSLRANYTHLLDFTQTKFGSEDTLDGEVGFSKDKVQAAAVYTYGPVRAQWKTTYLSDARPDNDPTSLFYYEVGSYTVHDVQLDWDVLSSGATLYAGVDNLFDEDPAVILSGVPGNTTGTNTAADVYDPIGQRWYVGARYRF